jgi:hypothetical protein
LRSPARFEGFENRLDKPTDEVYSMFQAQDTYIKIVDTLGMFSALKVVCRAVGSNPKEFTDSVGASFCNLRVLHASSTALSGALFRQTARR